MTSLDERVHRLLVDDTATPEAATAAADRIAELVRTQDPLLSAAAVDDLVDRVRARIQGLGPLEQLLGDPAVTDVLVNGPGPVWVERSGVVERTPIVLDRAAIDLLVERIVAPLGRRVDPVSPVVDGRLPDGSRVHVVVPPLAVDGPCLTIRRFGVRRVDLAEIAAPPVAALLRWLVAARANVIVAGGTGSGKTTLLNALGRHIAPTERVVTVEDAAELRLPLEHVVRLETRPASVEGVPAVSARELVRNALRMRPDRIVVGECRGGEALDMVQAMNTGHAGSLSTLHANGCDDALRRLETLVLLAGVGLPLEAVRDHVAAAVDHVVQVERDRSGRRRVVAVAEVPRRDDGARTEPLRTRPLAGADVVIAAPRRGHRDPTVAPFSSSQVTAP